jgi:membrane protein implicated in regulation of membrane protease activity
MQSPVNRVALESIDALLDEALHDTIVPPIDARLEAEVQRDHAKGLGLMVAACASVFGVPLLSASGLIGTVLRMLLFAAANAMLYVGFWFIDRARKRMLEHLRGSLADEYRCALSETPDVTLRAASPCRRQLGICYLVCACFCICVLAAPLTGRTSYDTAMWAGVAFVLIGLGAWFIEKAAKEAVHAQAMRDAALRRKASQSNTHIRRVP